MEGLADLSLKEIMNRLDKLAVEYDRTVKEAMAKLAKVDNLRKEIEPLAAELSRRQDG